ncbi:MAG: tetratricopeptide repeat protein, partial [Planctomycetes bacterium]|nr:tetratricopeptide repeat protein [Planctomycetota bacterium]
MRPPLPHSAPERQISSLPGARILAPLVFFAILSSASLIFCGESTLPAPSRRELRHLSSETPLHSRVAEDSDQAPSYDIGLKAHELHRLAIYHFYAGNDEEAEACFSMALKKSPNSLKILQDYALCSIFFSEKFKSLERARRLLERDTHLRSQEDARSILIEGILLAVENSPL